LLRAGADPNGVDGHGNSAIHHAAARGQGDLIETLVSFGGDVNTRNREGQSPLHSAHPACVLPLLQLAGDPHAKDGRGETPLHAQARRFDASTLPAVNSLLHFGADPNATDRKGNTVLHAAVDVGNTALIVPLIDQGADPYRKNAEGKPAQVQRLTGRDQEAAERVWQAQGPQFDLTRRTAGAPAW
jgi:ankyrin repeat protein